MDGCASVFLEGGVVYRSAQPDEGHLPRKKKKSDKTKKQHRQETKAAEQLRIADVVLACKKVAEGAWTRHEALLKLPRVKERTLRRFLSDGKWRSVMPVTLGRGPKTKLPAAAEILVVNWLIAMTRIGQGVPKQILVSKVRAIFEKLNSGEKLPRSDAERPTREHEAMVDGILERHNSSKAAVMWARFVSILITVRSCLLLQACTQRKLRARLPSRCARKAKG